MGCRVLARDCHGPGCGVRGGSVDIAAGGQYSTQLVSVWNSTVRLGFFLICLWLLDKMKTANDLLSHLAHTDSLTGAGNTRSFYFHLTGEIERLTRYKRPFTIAYADLDHFKSVNDALGHTAGDELLRIVAVALKGVMRGSDFLARLGGDEFAILMPETNEISASIALERACEVVNLAIKTSAGDVPGVGVTIGAMVFSTPPESADVAIMAADRVMYEGKHAGKNRIKISHFSPMTVKEDFG